MLDHLVRVFEAGVRYPEREVNALLAVWHPDVAALRRYLVDEGLLTREAGVYWRTGGYVEGRRRERRPACARGGCAGVGG